MTDVTAEASTGASAATNALVDAEAGGITAPHEIDGCAEGVTTAGSRAEAVESVDDPVTKVEVFANKGCPNPVYPSAKPG